MSSIRTEGANRTPETRIRRQNQHPSTFGACDCCCDSIPTPSAAGLLRCDSTLPDMGRLSACRCRTPVLRSKPSLAPWMHAFPSSSAGKYTLQLKLAPAAAAMRLPRNHAPIVLMQVSLCVCLASATVVTSHLPRGCSLLECIASSFLFLPSPRISACTLLPPSHLSCPISASPRCGH